MNTPTHLIIGAAAFARPGAWQVTAAALIGAFLPDLSLYTMAGWHLYVLETPPQIVFRQLYYSDFWQSIFAVDNSFLIWAALLGFALWSGRAWAVALTGAALLHLALDFPLHNHDARIHFWPLSNWVFVSPVSYWDSRHFGHLVRPAETVLNILLLIILWRRFPTRPARITFGTLMAIYAALFFVLVGAGR